jgi:hypothetical protein
MIQIVVLILIYIYLIGIKVEVSTPSRSLTDSTGLTPQRKRHSKTVGRMEGSKMKGDSKSVGLIESIYFVSHLTILNLAI